MLILETENGPEHRLA